VSYEPGKRGFVSSFAPTRFTSAAQTLYSAVFVTRSPASFVSRFARASAGAELDQVVGLDPALLRVARVQLDEVLGPLLVEPGCESCLRGAFLHYERLNCAKARSIGLSNAGTSELENIKRLTPLKKRKYRDVIDRERAGTGRSSRLLHEGKPR